MRGTGEIVDKSWFAESANIDLEQTLGGTLLISLYYGHILELQQPSVLTFVNVDCSRTDENKYQV